MSMLRATEIGAKTVETGEGGIACERKGTEEAGESINKERAQIKGQTMTK
jgi:hypothetical protein